jgi:predicted DsbA family dithiol-disulfide isomerase
MREKEQLHITGSPTIVLNEGRQKLYGNVGYGVIEANIKELLKSPDAGAASWC